MRRMEWDADLGKRDARCERAAFLVRLPAGTIIIIMKTKHIMGFREDGRIWRISFFFFSLFHPVYKAVSAARRLLFLYLFPFGSDRFSG